MYEVVIIDDEKWIRTLIKKLLPYDEIPIEVTGEAEDGREGLELLKRKRPHIVLTDIRMPILSGLDLIKEIKDILPNTEIIIISGYDNFEYAQKAITLGVLDFLLKPVEVEDLKNTIGKAVLKLQKKASLRNEASLLEQKVKRLTSDYIPVEPDEFTEINNFKIKKALKYIHDNYNNPISLNEVSDSILMNLSYFSELFKKEVGKGFNQYLIDLRFSKAKELLREQHELTIGDIAMIVGFHDPNYFSRLFKKKFNCTAQEYRSGHIGKEKI
ncbi:MAG: response regulator [Spirochaetaceae bacterium]|nr:response regulator [Spirochaetaceae bacterium]